MTAKEIRAIVVDRIYEGKSYQAVFDELASTNPDREHTLARLIADVPSLEQRKKYGLFNVALILLLTISILFKLILGLSFVDKVGAWAIFVMLIFPIVNVVLLVGVVTWKPKIYRPVGFVGCWSLLQMFKALTTPPFDPYFLLDLGMVAGFIFLGFFLGSKLGGKFTLGKQTYKDAKGVTKMKQVVRWFN